MKKSPFQNYFQYVQNVLGIKNIFHTAEAQSAVKIPLVIIIENLSTYTTEESELLKKMIGALQLEAAKFQIIDSLESAPASTYQLILKDDESVVSSSKNSTTTYSPRRLLQEPALKKVAWSAMQNALKKMQT